MRKLTNLLPLWLLPMRWQRLVPVLLVCFLYNHVMPEALWQEVRNAEEAQRVFFVCARCGGMVTRLMTPPEVKE